ncbi:MAG: Crp/Fnr family transcriptional regulator [Salibacteraceae bacterium]
MGTLEEVMEKLLTPYLSAIHPCPSEILDEYVNSWTEVSYPRKSIITQAGQVQRHIYFVIEGIQRSYFLHEAKEHVIAFTYPPSFTGIPESFWSQTPSRYYLETITPSRMLRMSFEQHQDFMERYRPLETLFRKGTEYVFSGFVHRYVDLMAFDIESRFKQFMERSPHLLHQIPHKDIASYLRIAPTNFSKLLGSVSI